MLKIALHQSSLLRVRIRGTASWFQLSIVPALWKAGISTHRPNLHFIPLSASCLRPLYLCPCLPPCLPVCLPLSLSSVELGARYRYAAWKFISDGLAITGVRSLFLSPTRRWQMNSAHLEQKRRGLWVMSLYPTRCLWRKLAKDFFSTAFADSVSALRFCVSLFLRAYPVLLGSSTGCLAHAYSRTEYTSYLECYPSYFCFVGIRTVFFMFVVSTYLN